jgi:hypothetical protein
MLSHFGGIVCDATASLNPKLAMQIAYVILLAMLFLVLGRFGVAGYAWALVAGQGLRNLFYIGLMKRVLQAGYKEIMKTYIPGLVNGVIVSAAIWAISTILRQAQSPMVIVLPAQLAVGATFFFFLTLVKPCAQLQQAGIKSKLQTLAVSGVSSLQLRALFK